MRKTFHIATVLLAGAALSTAQKVATDGATLVAPTIATNSSQPLPQVPTNTQRRVFADAAVTPKPLDMKLLLITGDGSEPAYESLRSFLEHVAIPYHAIVAKNQPLPPLGDSTKGFYQGILLTSGNLAINDAGNWRSALDPAGWTALDNYARDYRVRTVAAYAFPEPRYGTTFISSLSPNEAAPAYAALQPAGATLFSYLKPSASIKILYAFTFLGAAAPAAGETTVPVLKINGQVAGALHTKADGREYLSFGFDHASYLMHSLLLNYGMVNWVTRGVFIGSRQVYLIPQNDDHFLSNDLFVSNVPACQPVGPATDPTYDPAVNCPTLRMTGSDVDKLTAWQDRVNADPQFTKFKTSMAFNGFGTTRDGGAEPNDSLLARSKALSGKFFWVSHTYDHEHLDCFKPAPNSGICRPATYNESRAEISNNIVVAVRHRFPLDQRSMVTPNISGLTNPNFMRAAGDQGIRYMVGDTSRPGHTPVIPNTGIRSSIDPRILIIPRRATNIFYNAASPNLGANGSETDEYNFLYGPNGYFRMGNGQPFFTTTQSYQDIVNRESDALLTYMLRYEMYPSMFHQANFYAYNGASSLFTDVMDATMSKFKQLSSLPVSSVAQTELGEMLEERMQYLAANVRGVYTPGVSVTITTTGKATVPVTGVCKDLCSLYGAQQQSRIRLNAGQSITITGVQ
jgi:hypothetical protein